MHSRILPVILVLAAGSIHTRSSGAQSPATVPSDAPQAMWRFNADTRWNGWQPNDQIAEVRFEPDCVSFRTVGSDPMMVGPLFSWPQATNGQHVELDIESDTTAQGELYFTNTTEGPYNGFDSKWFVPYGVSANGRQAAPAWPFWQTLGKVVRLRVDPPSGARCRLYAIRIVRDDTHPVAPAWTFRNDASSWQPMYGTQLEPSDAGLRVRATQPMALVTSAVEPFAAERRSMLRMEVDCPGEHSICLYWADRDNSGLWGEPIQLPALGGGPIELDLRQFAAWKGTITNLAIGFGTYGREVLTLKSLSIAEHQTQGTLLRVPYLGYATGVGRPGKPVDIRAIVEHAAGPPLPAGSAVLRTDAHAGCTQPTVSVGALAAGGRTELTWQVVPSARGKMRITVSLNGQSFDRTLPVAPDAGHIARGDYDVPPPRPVKTDYQIGIYYFPGWSQLKNWQRQADWPERHPLLGWYAEGRPQVADWHIKWALENGISFFIYDWYWRDGREELGAALNDGFLKARYADQMKFAVMWANHKPFSGHTPAQLITVADYWIDRYLRRANYLTVEGLPYVSFYQPSELLSALGSPAKVRAALDAMRERARAAGLKGLHIAAIDIPAQTDVATLQAAGFDSFTAYTYIRTGTTVSHSLYRQWLAGYRDKWQQAAQASSLPYMPALAVGWDGPSWYGLRSERRRGRRTADLAEGLGRLKSCLDEKHQRLGILEAWNEWGEGAYLERNVEFGFADLEAVRETFAAPGAWPVSIGPEDVGIGGAYDMRRSASAVESQPR